MPESETADDSALEYTPPLSPWSPPANIGHRQMVLGHKILPKFLLPPPYERGEDEDRESGRAELSSETGSGGVEGRRTVRAVGVEQIPQRPRPVFCLALTYFESLKRHAWKRGSGQQCEDDNPDVGPMPRATDGPTSVPACHDPEMHQNVSPSLPEQ
ncbi:hypothetical protein THAOC_33699 [Thalassiosira oceanica]|uniref:Uncharacterized protein n=1 Tax=Thalassiosira oceanica TaxID=159749 RepID=K0RES6_THAOC|nr:hypothetical protein THAOC_33699 [Thalassiosira oceanica]|eukprot:EJK47571.1 hypothetical protein THAOC_33699 [Thalassiosira oceanica]